MQCVRSPCGIQMHLNKTVPSFPPKSSRLLSDINQLQHPAICYPYVHHCSVWQHLILLLLLELWLGCGPGKLQKTHWRNPVSWKKETLMAILESWLVLQAAKAEQQQQEMDTKEWAAHKPLLSLPELPVQPAVAQRGFVLGAVSQPCSHRPRSAGLLLEGDVWGVPVRSPCDLDCPTNKSPIHPMHKVDSPAGDLPTVPCSAGCTAQPPRLPWRALTPPPIPAS